MEEVLAEAPTFKSLTPMIKVEWRNNSYGFWLSWSLPRINIVSSCILKNINLHFHKQDFSGISQMKCMLFHNLVIHSETPVNKTNRQLYVKVIIKNTDTSCEICSHYFKKTTRQVPLVYLWLYFLKILLLILNRSLPVGCVG